eukprot:CAMPEP_0197687726 /NCGR_PEP_ID=MMETSP1338-20131121/104394_1 /TAXON_ID=43686 ORGANISM="Pelagodinium beii, Strain RCC1491" /NCGR_SAMPLE_ID=MMETSP1338 /ASSEMBLY_ACC=CAM_ASM_000754 /LENGTH=110 /DNA_ID=CAMNT_0043269859 /DNA_START=53 /DNA_END=384 /DNA_ORIENTATION=-
MTAPAHSCSDIQSECCQASSLDMVVAAGNGELPADPRAYQQRSEEEEPEKEPAPRSIVIQLLEEYVHEAPEMDEGSTQKASSQAGKAAHTKRSRAMVRLCFVAKAGDEDK